MQILRAQLLVSIVSVVSLFACTKGEGSSAVADSAAAAPAAPSAAETPSTPPTHAAHAPAPAHHHDASAPAPSASVAAVTDAGKAHPAPPGCPKDQIMAAGECVFTCDPDKPKCPSGKACAFAQFRNETGDMQGSFICQ